MKKTLKNLKLLIIILCLFAIATCAIACVYSAISNELTSNISIVYTPKNSANYYELFPYLYKGDDHSCVSSITFDFYADEGTEEYFVGGENVIAGIPATEVSWGEFNDIDMYRKANDERPDLEDVYLLSHSDIYTCLDMTSIFKDLTNCKTITLNNFNTIGTNSFWGTFQNSTGLEKVTFGDNVHTQGIVYLYWTFQGCTNLREVDFGNTVTFENVTSFYEMFSGCTNLQKIDFSNRKIYSATNFDRMFYKCSSLTKVNFGEDIDTSNVSTYVQMFDNCTNIQEIDFSHFRTDNARDFSAAFANCRNLKRITFGENFTCHNVTLMNNMFEFCEKLESVDLSMVDGRQLKVTERMFDGCLVLKNVTFGKDFTCENVYDMEFMFNDCKALTELDLSMMNTRSATDMKSMFRYCEKIEHIYVGDGWNVTNVPNGGNPNDTGSPGSEYMFFACSNLPNWAGNDVTDKHYAHTGEGGYLTHIRDKVS